MKDYVGLKPNGNESWLVYFGPIPIGELHEKERGNIRPAKTGTKRGAVEQHHSVTRPTRVRIWVTRFTI